MEKSKVKPIYPAHLAPITGLKRQIRTRMKKSLHFVIPDSIETAGLTEKIDLRFTTATASAAFHERRYFDTFDWRLYHRNLNLYWQQGTLYLFDLSQANLIASTPWPAGKRPAKLDSFPAGPLREKLSPIIEIRSLLLLANPQIKQQQINILNRDMKTIAQLYLKKFHLSKQFGDPLFSTLSVVPVRGYHKDALKCTKFALSLGLVPADETSILNSVYRFFGQKPGSYSTKLDLACTPEQPAGTAAIAIFQSQLAIMRQNQEGIRADIDTEFLHDFRVALRRSRAGLSEIKGIFSKDVTKRFKADLKRFATMTNRLRDLDVYLLKKDYYKSLLPEKLQPELEHLFRLLERERNREKKKVQQALNGSSYENTITEWSDFLASFQLGNSESGPKAKSPILDLGKIFIFQAWKKVVTMGRGITLDSPDEALHKLRLECKKLRYLLEFFASLFPEKQMNYLVKQLKQLQENLGDFNDLCVQQATLHDYLANQVQTNHSFVNIAAAIGGLITNLNMAQQGVRAVFNTKFKQFDQHKNRDLLQKLFEKGRHSSR